jgi:replicative DNA helicase
MGETNSGKSLWLQNIAINAANAGKNVIYFSLEMSEKKVMKRLGAMRLRIPINEYEDTAKNKEYMQERLVKMRKSIASNNGNAFDKKLGKIYVKEFPAGQATISDFDNYCKKWEEKYDEKIDMIIVDYITIMAPERGLQLENNLYMKGKHLAEGLRSLGYKYESPVVTAIQVGKDAWSANDINLASVPESKAIPETADTFWGIIRSPEMKRLNLYRLKALKLRDGNFEKDQVMFDLNPKYLCIENDRYNETD